ncbi:MAG: GerMN domain-containing protein [Candidatus Muiribacteriota bacterium]
MKDTYGIVKLVFKLIWFAFMLVAFYFLFFHQFEEYQSEIPDRYIRDDSEYDSVEMSNYIFYYSDGYRLIPEDREIKIVDEPLELAGNIIEEYMKGPENNDLYYPIPKKTGLRAFFLYNNSLYIDFTREFNTNYKGGVIPEILALYGVVNTVTQIEAVERVKFLINGEDSDIILSHLYTGEYIYPDNSLIHRF